MRVVKSVSVEEIVCRGSIKDSDVSRLSKAFVSDQHLSEQDADTLFAMTVACPVQAPSWNRFFVDTVAGYVLRQMEPEGYVTAEKAAWLRQRIVSGGRVRSSIEFDLLMNVIERARWVPLSLVALALEEIKAAVINGDGPLEGRQGHGAWHYPRCRGRSSAHAHLRLRPRQQPAHDADRGRGAVRYLRRHCRIRSPGLMDRALCSGRNQHGPELGGLRGSFAGSDPQGRRGTGAMWMRRSKRRSRTS